MFLQQRASPEFFRRRPQVVGPDGTARCGNHSHDRFLAGQVGGGERRILALRHDDQVIVQRQDAAPTGATVPVLSQAP
jgi:hypothetical protein